MRIPSRIAILGLCGLLVVACRGPRSSPLFGELESYQSPEDVRDDLNVSQDRWRVVEERKPLPSDKRPPFRWLKVSVEDYPDRGVEGQLVLSFFNERLMETVFYPSDLDRYRNALEGRKIIFGKDMEARISPSTRVWIGEDADGRRYVGWIDLNLRAERNDWIRKYS